MKRSPRAPLVGLLGVVGALAVLVLPGGGAALAQPTPVEVLPGQGVSFSQLDFTWTGATTLNSDTGQVDADIDTLKAETGMTAGFINVGTDTGWVVQNLPVSSEFPYPVISTRFDLHCTVGVNVTSLDGYVEFSSDPITNLTIDSLRTFSVGDAKYNAQGLEGAIAPGVPEAPGAAGAAAFTLDGQGFFGAFQAGHPFLETADDQCLPAAVATSLQWLEDTYGINVPHPNVMGLGADGSLVGQLETEMGRTFRNRRDGDPLSGQDGLEGKLCYLADNGLGGLSVKHQGMGTFGSNPFAAVCTGGTKTSTGMGPKVTAAFLIGEIENGEDVELGWLYDGGGGHFVEVVGAGVTLGTPWLAYQSDTDQTDDTQGTGVVYDSDLVDNDGDTNLNLFDEPGKPEAALVFSQSPPPVGGIAELPPLSADEAGAATGGSGWSAGTYAALAGVTVVAVAGIAAGGWYVRRRWIG